MEQLNIRKAVFNDAEYISLLGRITFTETFAHYFQVHQDLLDYYEKTFSVSKIKAGLQNGNNVFWIALWDGLPVGYAKLKKHSLSEFIKSDNISQLQKIYVLKDFHSKKIGYKLQEEVLKESIKLGKEFLWLSVLQENSKAISFYEKSGFAGIGKHTFSIGREDFKFRVMEKRLNELK